MPRFDFKYVSDLVIGEWTQIDGTWVEVMGCVTDGTGWTRLSAQGLPLPETIMHRTVEVPWSRTKPAGAA